MSYWHDIRDWLGGYPMEFAGNKETEIFCRERFGVSLVNIKAGEANTEFLFCPAGQRVAMAGPSAGTAARRRARTVCACGRLRLARRRAERSGARRSAAPDAV